MGKTISKSSIGTRMGPSLELRVPDRASKAKSVDDTKNGWKKTEPQSYVEEADEIG